MTKTALRLDAKSLYRRLDNIFGTIQPGRSQTRVLHSFLEESYRILKEDLHLKGCVLYAESGEGFELQKVSGTPTIQTDETLDPTSPWLQQFFRNKVCIFDNQSNRDKPSFAALVVGEKPNRNILLYYLDSGWVREELDFTLNAIRAALGARIIEERLRGSLNEAAAIQQSLLIEEPPIFEGFDIACKSIPAEEVGGDFFDFTIFENQILGIAIGDASGHGLPAALLVRDVVTGLRMGIERHLKVAHVFEKLNHVIHRSMLSSRFVSLFYAELEQPGNLIYVNAGHQPPLLFNEDSVEALERGGSVIGPLPEVRFQRGITQLLPGSVLLLTTDGIVERRNAQGEFFGDARLEKVIRANQGNSAQVMLDHLFAEAFDYGGGRAWEDDATGVIVIRK